MYMYILFIHSSINGQMCWFYILAIVNDSAMKMEEQIALGASLFIFFGHIPQSGIAICSILWNIHTVFHSRYTIYTVTKDSLSPHPQQYFFVSRLFDDTHANKCKVMCCCGFDLHFPYT